MNPILSTDFTIKTNCNLLCQRSNTDDPNKTKSIGLKYDMKQCTSERVGLKWQHIIRKVESVERPETQLREGTIL